MEARGRAAETQQRQAAWLAWQTASLNAYAFHKPGKMPSLESLTAPRPKVEVQTPDQMRAVFAGMRRRAERRNAP